MSDWRPGANREALRARATLSAEIRQFFVERDVLEVETPLLCEAGVTDPALEPFQVAPPRRKRFLQTSPEYAMKRLLAADVGDIFQLCKAFRVDESGSRHNPEFTLLEWYRCGFDHWQLMREVATLVTGVLGRTGWQVWPWGRLLKHVLDLDPHRAGQEELEACVQSRLSGAGIEPPDGLDRDGLLDLLVSHCVEPAIAGWGVVFITDYPASQAALARIHDVNGIEVGARFECYVDGLELANGYWECLDEGQLRARFEADNHLREQRGQQLMPLDERFLAAVAAGLPNCSGVALGVDRLLALKIGGAPLGETLAFDWHRC